MDDELMGNSGGVSENWLPTVLTELVQNCILVLTSLNQSQLHNT